MAQEIFFKSERQFDLVNISKEIERTKRLVEEKFSDKIRTITELIEAQTRLVGIYTSQLLVRRGLRSTYEENGIVNNALLNFPYRSLSILLLIRNAFYGSARIVCRQFLESLIIAKYSEYDLSLVRKWELQYDEKNTRMPSSEISLRRDVFRGLENRGKTITALLQTWKDLCSVTHATPYSQQVLRVPDSADEKDGMRWLVNTGFFGNSEYSLDLLMTLLAMNFHLLLGHYGRKANRWYFGYLRDPYGSYDRERKLKEKCKTLIREFFEKSNDRKGAKELWRRNIFEFRQSWGFRK